MIQSSENIVDKYSEVVEPVLSQAEEENTEKREQTLIKDIVEHHEAERMQRDPLLCPICLNESNKLIAISECGHQFCEECLEGYIHSCVASFKRFQCPQQSCSNVMKSEKLTPLIEAKYKLAICKIEKHYFLLDNTNLKSCKIDGCPGVFDIFQMPYSCRACGVVHCPRCFELQHQGDCEQRIAKLLEANKKFRQCKKCRQVIEKVQGCSHMTCLCGHYFCYSCGATLSGTHTCEVPSELNCMQKVRWEIEHIELWYESSYFTFLRGLVFFEPEDTMPVGISILWLLFFTAVIYPLLIALALTVVVTFLTLMFTAFVVFIILQLFIANCGSLDLLVHKPLKHCCGVYVGFVIIVLLYPFFFILDLFDLVFRQLICRNNREFWEFMGQIAIGLRNVLLFPCLMLTSNRDFYEQEIKREGK